MQLGLRLRLLYVVARRACVRAAGIRRVIDIVLLSGFMFWALCATRYMSIGVMGVDCHGPTLLGPGRAFNDNLGIDLSGAGCT